MHIRKGAEAIVRIYSKIVVKTRNRKAYRVMKLDKKLRKERTRREYKILKKASSVVDVPMVKKLGKYSFSMERIEGEKPSPSKSLAEKMAEKLALLHSVDIIHGDFTPANVLQSNDVLFVIDFGLGFISKRVEDKADDLYTLIASMPEFSKVIEEAYLKKGSKEVVKRVEKIKRRRRYVA